MSRAFITELDGWNSCRSQKIECCHAALDGSCELGACKFNTDPSKGDAGIDTAKKQSEK